MTPVVAVDQHAFRRGTNERAIDREVSRPPRRGDEYEAQSGDQRGQGHRQVDDAGEPAPRQEAVEVGVVRILGEDVVELERPDAERLVERDLRAKNVTAEAAEMADGVGLPQAPPVP